MEKVYRKLKLSFWNYDFTFHYKDGRNRRTDGQRHTMIQHRNRILLADADVIGRVFFSAGESGPHSSSESNYFKLRRLSWAGAGERRDGVIMYGDKVVGSPSRAIFIGLRSTSALHGANAPARREFIRPYLRWRPRTLEKWRHRGGFLSWKVQLVLTTCIFYRCPCAGRRMPVFRGYLSASGARLWSSIRTGRYMTTSAQSNGRFPHIVYSVVD